MAAVSPDVKAAADAAFERSLLASAKLDAPADGGAKLAMTRFALAAAAMAAIGAESSVASASGPVRSVAKWLALGAFVGGAVVAAYLEGARHGPAAAPQAGRLSSVAAPSPNVTTATPTETNAREQPRPLPPTTPSKVSAARERAVATRGSAGRTARTLPTAPASASSSLREEVARLDAARTALAIGDFNAVSQTLERYRMDFPKGALAREADLVGINALAEQGDSAEAWRLARRFLSRYPHDVHAARVKQLVSWQRRLDDVQ